MSIFGDPIFSGGKGSSGSVIARSAKSDFGCAGDGSTDDTSKLLSAVNSGEYVWLDAGSSFLLADLTVTSLRLMGPGKIVYPSGHFGIQVDDTWGAETAISAFSTTTIGNMVVTRVTANATGLSVGQAVKFFSQDLCSFTSNGNNVWRSEIAIIRNIDVGLTFFDLDRQLYWTYTTSPVFRTLPSSEVMVDGITFQASGNYADTSITSRKGGLIISAAVNPRVTNVKFLSGWERCIELNNCVEGVFDATFQEVPDRAASNAYGYGFAVMHGSIGNSIRARGKRTRHLITGGSDQYASYTASAYKRTGTTFNNIIHDSISMGGNGGAAFDTHEPCIGWVYDNCLAIPSIDPLASDNTNPIGFLTRGAGMTFKNCGVKGPLPSNGVGFDDRMLNVDFTGLFAEPTNRYDNCWVERAGIGIQANGVAANTSGKIIIDGCRIQDVDGINNVGIKTNAGFKGRLVIPKIYFDKMGTCMFGGDAGSWDVGDAWCDFLGQSQAQVPFQISFAGTVDVRFAKLVITQKASGTPGGVVKMTNAATIVNLKAGLLISDKMGSGTSAIPLLHSGSTGGSTLNHHAYDERFIRGTASPVSSIVPAFICQFYLDTTNNKLWVSVGLTSADWKGVAIA